MLALARSRVPQYRELYRELPDDALLELEQLPFIDKQTIRGRADEHRLSRPAPPLTRVLLTSGTTGELASTAWPPRAAWHQGLLTLRMASAQGLPLLHRRAVIWWQLDERSRGGLFGRLRQRHLQLSAYESPATLAETVREARPDAVWAQPNLLIELGEWLDGSFRPRVVNTVGQELTHEDRATIARIYGYEPLDVYSTSELGVVAWQCAAADLYHINHDAVIVEVLDDHGDPAQPGTSGELVLTGLSNALMPYLRYRIGDGGAIATRPCRCGSRLPALERIEGRLSDWFLDEHGRRIAPHRLWLSVHLKGGLGLFKRYQLQQLPTKRVLLRLVPRGELDEGVLQSLRCSYQRLLGDGIPIEIELVDSLREERSRKFRTIMALSAETEGRPSGPASR